MRPEEIAALLDEMRAGTTTVDDALKKLQRSPTGDLGFAKVDLHREVRQGMPEAIYGDGKTPAEVVAIAAHLLENTTSPVLVTRANAEVASAVRADFPNAEYHERARMLVVRKDPPGDLGTVAVVTAGTSDLPVADEAAVTLDAVGAEVTRITDSGVAGIHRILEEQDALREADVVIVVAGMEGALPSVVGGLVGAPVIAVPTSVGYGASFEGLAALLGMLNSCAAGIAVTNIDNGFGAGMLALRILRSRKR
jgi:pyridinium-3,5-biscarboxylic acid mononucleotide synthase